MIALIIAIAFSVALSYERFSDFVCEVGEDAELLIHRGVDEVFRWYENRCYMLPVTILCGNLLLLLYMALLVAFMVVFVLFLPTAFVFYLKEKL